MSKKKPQTINDLKMTLSKMIEPENMPDSEEVLVPEPPENQDVEMLRDLVKEVLTLEAYKGRILDRATNQISRSAVDVIKDSEIREKHSKLPEGGQLQLSLEDAKSGTGGSSSVDSSLVDIETVGRIILILEVTEGELWTAGAYQYNPSDRSQSDLIVALGLPRDYDLSILSLVIPDLKEAIRHELEHGTESTQTLQSRDLDYADSNHFRDKEAMVKYYTQGGETEGHVSGLYKKAKHMKIPVSLVINDFLTDVFQRALASGLSQADADSGTGEIASAWYEYLTNRWPDSINYLQE